MKLDSGPMTPSRLGVGLFLTELTPCKGMILTLPNFIRRNVSVQVNAISMSLTTSASSQPVEAASMAVFKALINLYQIAHSTVDAVDGADGTHFFDATQRLLLCSNGRSQVALGSKFDDGFFS